MRHSLVALLAVAAVGVLSGCRIIAGTAAVAVGAVGLVGYGVYKTGEAVVTGVGSAVAGVTGGGGRSVAFVDGEFKAECEGTVEDVWVASEKTLKANGFQSVTGTRDALSGRLEAVTWNREQVVVKLEASGPKQTELRLRIGAEGDLKKCETLYGLIAAQLARDREVRGPGRL